MAGHLKTVQQKFNLHAGKKIVIVVAQWNDEITQVLCTGAMQALHKAGISKQAIRIQYVPGSFELPLAALRAASSKNVAGVICLGCIIQGETPHFQCIAQAVAHGIMDVSLKTNKPVSFGVLTTHTLKQAEDRAGGKWGNKGEEAAVSMLQML